MASRIEDLFDQIIQSEERAQERKNVLQEVKTEIQQYKESILNAEQDKEDLKLRLTSKVQEENDKELKLNWMVTREKILKDQTDVMRIQKNKIESDIKLLMERASSERETFCRSVDVFSKGFGLASNGPAVRLACKQDEITHLQQDKQLLENDLEQYKAKQERIKELGLKNAEAIGLLDKAVAIEIDVLSRAEMEQETLDKLEKEKTHVSEIPLTGAEFKRIQAELEQARQESKESLCEKMRQQYQQLQQQLWQNEVNLQRGKRASSNYTRWNGMSSQEPTDNTATWHNSVNRAQIVRIFHPFVTITTTTTTTTTPKPPGPTDATDSTTTTRKSPPGFTDSIASTAIITITAADHAISTATTSDNQSTSLPSSSLLSTSVSSVDLIIIFISLTISILIIIIACVVYYRHNRHNMPHDLEMSEMCNLPTPLAPAPPPLPILLPPLLSSSVSLSSSSLPLCSSPVIPRIPPPPPPSTSSSSPHVLTPLPLIESPLNYGYTNVSLTAVTMTMTTTTTTTTPKTTTTTTPKTTTTTMIYDKPVTRSMTNKDK